MISPPMPFKSPIEMPTMIFSAFLTMCLELATFEAANVAK
jgi:hypothetical protein